MRLMTSIHLYTLSGSRFLSVRVHYEVFELRSTTLGGFTNMSLSGVFRLRNVGVKEELRKYTYGLVCHKFLKLLFFTFISESFVVLLQFWRGYEHSINLL